MMQEHVCLYLENSIEFPQCRQGTRGISVANQQRILQTVCLVNQLKCLGVCNAIPDILIKLLSLSDVPRMKQTRRKRNKNKNGKITQTQ